MSTSLEYSDDASARAVSDGDPSSSAPDDASPRGVSDASFEASDDDHVALMIAELVDNYDGY